jgi:hypothetical protein
VAAVLVLLVVVAAAAVVVGMVVLGLSTLALAGSLLNSINKSECCIGNKL